MMRTLGYGLLFALSLTAVACADAYGGNDADPAPMVGPKRPRAPKGDAGADAATPSADANADAGQPKLEAVFVVDPSNDLIDADADAGAASVD